MPQPEPGTTSRKGRDTLFTAHLNQIRPPNQGFPSILASEEKLLKIEYLESILGNFDDK